MSIGYFGELAFGTGVVLTSLTLNEPVTIQAMGLLFMLQSYHHLFRQNVGSYLTSRWCF